MARSFNDILNGSMDDVESDIPSKMYSYPSRVACTVLGEMRKLLETTTPISHDRLMALLPSMVEELQVFFNRMESALEDQNELLSAHDKISRIKKIHNTLRKECLLMEKVLEKHNESD